MIDNGKTLKTIELPLNVVEETINYLSMKPYREVYGLLNTLLTAVNSQHPAPVAAPEPSAQETKGSEVEKTA